MFTHWGLMTYIHQGTGSSVVQAVTSVWRQAKYHLNQCLHIVNWTPSKYILSSNEMHLEILSDKCLFSSCLNKFLLAHWLPYIKRLQIYHSSSTFYIYHISCDISHQIPDQRRLISLVEGGRKNETIYQINHITNDIFRWIWNLK